MGRKKKQTVSEYANALADKHNLNVTVVRDILEDVRRDVHERARNSRMRGPDIYRALRGDSEYAVEKLMKCRFPKIDATTPTAT